MKIRANIGTAQKGPDHEPELRSALASAWAKWDDPSGDSMALLQHCIDAGCVAEDMWETHVPDSAKRSVISWLSKGDNPPTDAEELSYKLAVFLTTIHDAGKFSPAFAMQVEPLKNQMEDAGLKFPQLTTQERRKTHHTVVSAKALQVWLEEKLKEQGRLSPRTRMSIQTLATPLGGHHGKFPTNGAMQSAAVGSKGFGVDEIWQAGREEIFSLAQKLACLTDEELVWLAIRGLDQPSQVIITAFIIMCDWIASNAELFPYHRLTSQDARTEDALDQLGLPFPWVAEAPETNDVLFRDRFSLPKGSRPRPMQEAVADAARTLKEPGLLIVEAPTGEGKTEAALAAAEILATNFSCGGVMVALPTQATSNAMFDRVLRWLHRSVPSDEEASVSLMHGKAQFNKQFEALKGWSSQQIYDEGASTDEVHEGITAHWWISGRKKSVLADFVVGTIDQVLLAALQAKHVVLRQFGIASKVVILDEIHAADSYMAVYLDRALEWLGALGVPVVALSATLPPKRRVEMISAYHRGAGVSEEDQELAAKAIESANGYPLITSSEVDPITCEPSGRSLSTVVSFLDNTENDAAVKALELVSDGGCIAVIHNTVKRAQDTFSLLQKSLGEDVVLLHSRFIATDRLKLEEKLVSQLGADGVRPHRLVVVATQVIEQSLDLDFDAMVSDLAPIDSLIQRMGRLHRHNRPPESRPEQLREPQFFICGVEQFEGAAPELEPGSKRIYGESILLRTMAALECHLSSVKTVTSPDDIPNLVKEAYSSDLVAPEGWEAEWQQAETERANKIAGQETRASTGLVEAPRRRAKPLYGWAQADDQAKAVSQSVRDILESIEVIAVTQGADGRVRTLSWIDDFPDEPLDGTLLDNALAKATARCTLALPAWFCQGERGEKLIRQLESGGMVNWQQSSWLKGELPLIFDENLSAKIPGFTLKYDHLLGLLYEKETT